MSTYRYSYGMAVGTYSPKPGTVECGSFEEAAKHAKDFFTDHPMPVGIMMEEDNVPVCILLTHEFTGAVFDFQTLERRT